MRRTPTAKLAGHDADQKEKERYRKNDAVNRMYKTGRLGRAWMWTSRLVRSANPICQKIVNGEQCTNPSTLVHHLQSPRSRPELFLSVKNLVALCDSCHVPDDGTPEWVEGVHFVKTIEPQHHIAGASNAEAN
jgi:hypothetical protein